MPCPCGSLTCSCDGMCFCRNVICCCGRCASIAKFCPRCRLPFFAALSSKNSLACSCENQTQILHPETHYNLQSTDSEMSYPSSVPPACPRCKLPIPPAHTDSSFDRNAQYCCCHPKKRSSACPGMLQSEHETSNAASDHREVVADRQVRKALSRKTRNEKSNWQAKKAKERSSNSAEGYSTNSDPDNFSVLNPSNHFLVTPANAPFASPGSIVTGFQNLNTSFSNQPRFGDTSTSYASLVNAPGVSAHSVPQAYQPFGFILLNQNYRGQIPRPFPYLPHPIPGPPAFGAQIYPPPDFAHILNLTTARQNTPRAFMSQQLPVDRTEKMDRWFETIENVLNTSGELPSAEAAATLDQMDKQRLEEEQYSYPEELHERDSVPAASDNGKDKEDTETTTDTDRSTTVSKSRKESESD